ncbi:MAG: two-component regulator propeller domain-containing protein, partial [Cystobacter sp.]
MLQDAEGFIWVCAADRVYRFDGAHFEFFGRDSGLLSMNVVDMTLDERGRLVLVTSGGVVRWSEGRFVELPLPGISEKAWTLRVDALGRTWVGTEKGLYWGTASEPFRLVPGGPRGPVSVLWVDGSGAVQVASGAWLMSREPGGQWSSHETPGHPGVINALARDGQGRLWLGAEGWLAMQPEPGAPVRDRSALLSGLTGAGSRLRVGREGQLLVPYNSGLLELRGDQLVPLELGLKEASSRIRDVMEEARGPLWVSGLGLHRSLGRGLWRVHDASTGLPSSVVWGLTRGPDGTLWVGTDKGLARGTAEGWVPVPGLEGYSLKAVSVARDGAVWAAGNPAGLHRYEPWSGRLRTFGPEANYLYPYSFAMHWAPDGVLWVATSAGVSRGVFSGEVPFFSLVLPAKPQGVTADLSFDAHGRLWVPGDGLQLLEGGTLRRFGVADGLRNERLGYMVVRRDGRVCVSYEDPLGVSCFGFRDGRLTDPVHLDHAQGLRSDVVYQLGEDAAGRLWVGTGAGVHLVGDGGVLEHFGSSGGAPGNEATGNSFLADADGTVWVGSVGGLGR